MPNFWYKALTGTGAVEEGWMNAPSELVVEEHLRSRGAFLITAEPRTRKLKVTDAKIDRKELLALLEYMSGSFSAGLPLLTTLDDVPRRLRSTKLKAIMAEVRLAIAEEGMSLSEALAQHPKAFSQLLISTIHAGEASGQLAFALQQLVEQVEWQENISSSVRQATMYPIIVLGAAGLLVFGLVAFVFPRIIPILRVRSKVELPLPTRVIMGTSAFLNQYWWVVLLSVVILAIGIVLLRRTPRGRQVIDGLILKIPGLGPLLLDVYMARVVTYLGLFYRSGVDLIQSLLLVQNMATNRIVEDIVRDARERISAGESIATAFGRSPLVPIIVTRSLALGESTGRLDESLDRAKAYYSREIPAAVRRTITLIQPLMIILLGGIVLTVALAIILPIMNIYNTIGIRRP